MRYIIWPQLSLLFFAVNVWAWFDQRNPISIVFAAIMAVSLYVDCSRLLTRLNRLEEFEKLEKTE